MNKHIQNPIMVIMQTPYDEPRVQRDGRKIFIPTNIQWSEFKTAIAPITDTSCDSVLIYIAQGLNLDKKGMVQNIDIKLNQITKMATDAQKPVLNQANDVWYLLNPSWDDMKDAHGYAPSDKVILNKVNAFNANKTLSPYEHELVWQKHQSEVWSRMADMMPLSDGKYQNSPNHVEVLTNQNRGLEKEDIGEFWSWKSNKILAPGLIGDDMIGMPGIVGTDYDDFFITADKGDKKGQQVPIQVRSIKTIGMSGIAIPMANVEGNVPKYQVATDASVINVRLKARAADNVSIQKSEYFNKKTNEYLFEINGQPSHLKCVMASAKDVDITFQDINGQFAVHMKDDIKDLLIQRGYTIPPLIDSLKVSPNAKYIWLSKGSMIGSDKVAKTVSPSNAGFITAREPKNGKDDYVVLVTEGALKGHIVAKYANVVDKENKSFGDYIAKDSGIIVAQVPGVSKAFVESVKPIYDHYKVKGTYIAMDADGRENKAVADGIATAETSLSEKSPIKVMSWNPIHKGLDDALLAVAQQKITLTDMGIHFGSSEKLFPLAQAVAPNPYRLDGTRANTTWKDEYEQDKIATNKKIENIQKDTQQRAKDLMDNGSDLAAKLPTNEQSDIQK